MATTTDKIDFKREYKAYYSPKPQKPEILNIPDFLFIKVDGFGDPNGSPLFVESIQALYGVSYGIKFLRKKADLGPDYSMGPLEGLWWNKSGTPYEMGEKKDWLWTLMIMQPILVCPDEFSASVEQLVKRKPDNSQAAKVRLEEFNEGTVVQMMHIGPYDQEGPSADMMREYAKSQGYVQSGRHHEIYLSDPGRVAPEKMKTILRVAIVKPE